MIRRFLVAAGALALVGCSQASETPPPANAPAEQEFQMPAPQASLSAEERAQLEGIVKGYLDGVQTSLAQGMTPVAGMSDEISAMQPGRDHRWQVNLTGGTAYRVIGACDNECSNLDLELIDSTGAVVASDMLPDDAPVMNFTPAANATFTVRLLMQTCTVAPCYAGARVLTGS